MSRRSSRSSASSTSKKKRPRTEYSWREGSRFGIDPQKAGERLAQLKAKHGREVEAQDVLADAEDPRSPFHSEIFHFGDDASAAKKYRLDLARRIITSLTVYVEIVPGKQPVAVAAYQNVEPLGAPGRYEHWSLAFSKKGTRDIIVARALQQFKALQQRYLHLSELRDVFEALDMASKSVERGKAKRRAETKEA